jgi:hypothetical protein
MNKAERKYGMKIMDQILEEWLQRAEELEEKVSFETASKPKSRRLMITTNNNKQQPLFTWPG